MDAPQPEIPRSEWRLLEDLRRRIPVGEDVLVGPGDDCAVLRGDRDRDLLLTTDMLVEGRHFLLEGLAPRALGWKALAVSVSDVAAMGGRSRHAVVSVALPRERAGAFADDLTEGLLECAGAHGVNLVGGDVTSTPGPVVVNVALLGECRAGAAVLRSGARPGDALCVTGALGGSRTGRHLRPTPRQEEALSLVQGGVVHAMIDLSDGISTDLARVCAASGVGAVLFAAAVPVHADVAAAAAVSGRPPLAHALHDGEDFELLFAVPHARAALLVEEGLAGTAVHVVGRVTAGDDVVLQDTADRPDTARPLPRGGHDHFGAP